MSLGPLGLLDRIVGILDEVSIPYAIGGSFAASFFGEPRATADLDVAIVADAVAGEALLARLGVEFYVPEASARAAIRSHESFNAIPTDSAMKVDLFPLGQGLLDRRQIERRVGRTLPSGRVVWVTSPEDVVLRKLDWYQQGGQRSDRQWNDVVGVLRVTSERMDLDDLLTAALTLGLDDLLDSALVEADVQR